MRLIMFPFYSFHTFLFPVILIAVMGWICVTINNENHRAFTIAKRFMYAVLCFEVILLMIDLAGDPMDIDLYRYEKAAIFISMKEFALSICVVVFMHYLDRFAFNADSEKADDDKLRDSSSVQTLQDDQPRGQSSSQVLEKAMKQVEEASKKPEAAVETARSAEPVETKNTVNESEANVGPTSSSDRFDFSKWVVESDKK